MIHWTLDQLIVLEAIQRTGSFAGAAKELHRVPSAISYSVRTLEEQLDVGLFDRSSRTAAFTPAGRRILATAKQVIQQADSLQGLADHLSGGWEAELHVIVDGALPMEPITKCLQAFHDPDIPTRIRLDVEYQEGVPHRFEAERAHLMIPIGFSGDGDTDGLALTPLPPLHMLLLIAPNHPLASSGVCTQAEAANHIEVVVRDSAPQFTAQPKASFTGTRNVMYLADFHSKRLALVQGAGFGWLPRHLVNADIADGRLIPLAIDGRSEWTYSPQLAAREGVELGKAAQHFIQTLLAVVKVTESSAPQ